MPTGPALFVLLVRYPRGTRNRIDAAQILAFRWWKPGPGGPREVTWARTRDEGDTQDKGLRMYLAALTRTLTWWRDLAVTG
jgi:hypothetical protein